MIEFSDLTLQIGSMVAGAGAIYGAIKTDLRAMHERIGRIERASDQAHDRIDKILEQGAVPHRRSGDLA